MDDIKTLVKQGKNEEAANLPETSLSGADFFFRVSALLSLGRTKEAMEVLLSHRKELYAIDPKLTLKANFEVRFALNQFDEAEADYKEFADYPYVSQEIEETLRDLPGTIAATRFAGKGSSATSLDEALEILSSPSDDLMVLSALNALKKVGELEDYRGLVEELLVGPCHDDVKTYALMLLSAKGSTHEVTLVKGGESLRVVPAKLGAPYQTKEYQFLRKRLEALPDQALTETAGELLDLYALIRYPRRFVNPGEVGDFYLGLLALGKSYLRMEEGSLSPKAKQYKALMEEAIAKNPPLFG